MKCNGLKNKVVLLLVSLLVCGFAGCGKEGEDASKPPVTPTGAVMSTQEETIKTESTPVQGVTNEQKITPAPTLTSEQETVTFPVEINESTFPEQVLRKKAQEADDNGDGVLSEEEAKTVTKLHLKKLADADAKDAMENEPLPEYKVTDFVFDLEGIQYFTELSELTVNLLGGEAFVEGGTEEEILVTTKNFNRLYECKILKKLSLYEVDIPSLDLSEFPNLKRLELNFMYNLDTVNTDTHGNLSALWISECHKLETVELSGVESIKTVDIVRNDSLKNVTFGEVNGKLENIQLSGLKSLTEVDISGLENLKSLNLTEVGLTDLDVSKNTGLEQFCAEGLQLDTLDLSNNPNVTYVINDKDSFRTILLPKENRIDMIRWTNSKVTEFPVENLNPETLTGIDIQGTAIKELDVSGYPKLEYLYYDEDVTKIKR